MHEHFAKWYAEVSIGDDGSRRDARWEGIINIVANLEFTDLESLFQLCFGARTKPNVEAISRLYRPFVDSDPAFDVTANEREVKILAGAALIVLMDSPDLPWGDQAALGATTAGTRGRRTHDLPQDLPRLGERAIRRRAEANRARPKVYTEQKGPQVKLNVEQIAEKLSESFDANAVAQEIGKFGTLVQSRLSALAKQHAGAMQALEHFLQIQDEEIDMLWWLMGEYSTSYGCPFTQVPTKARPVVFSAELVEMTKVLPGPTSLPALLSRSGLSGRRKSAIVSVVNAVSEDWLAERVSTNSPSPLVTPIHEALKRRLETGEGEAWVAGWSAVTGLVETLELNPLEMAMQFYSEALYLKDM